MNIETFSKFKSHFVHRNYIVKQLLMEKNIWSEFVGVPEKDWLNKIEIDLKMLLYF